MSVLKDMFCIWRMRNGKYDNKHARDVEFVIKDWKPKKEVSQTPPFQAPQGSTLDGLIVGYEIGKHFG